MTDNNGGNASCHCDCNEMAHLKSISAHLNDNEVVALLGRISFIAGYGATLYLGTRYLPCC